MPVRPTTRSLVRLALLATALFSAVSCASLDREGKKPIATANSEAPLYAVRDTVIEVFGRNGYRATSPAGNPLVFEREASKLELLAYKDLGEFESEIISRAYVEMTPTETGTRLRLRALTLSRPNTMFEDAKFPLIGSVNQYKKILKQAAREAENPENAPYLPPGPARPIVPKASSDYEVPLPLEAR